MDEELREIIRYYAGRNAARDQRTLVAMLREVQTLCGGALSEWALEEICGELELKRSYLTAIMRYIPDLRTEQVRHRLTVCGGKNCKSKGSMILHSHIEEVYGARNGGTSAKGGFSYQVGGCMKHCKEGPCVQWDGTVYTRMTTERLDQLIGVK